MPARRARPRPPITKASPPPPPELHAQVLSADEARALALSAQGFDVGRPLAAPRVEDVLATVERVRLLQLDSVNVLVRAHYLPLFSRLGPYDPALLDQLTYERRALFEFWAHEASILPVRFHPLLRWRMERKAWPSLDRIRRKRPEYVEAVLRELATRGPLGTSDLTDGGGRAGAWWGWGEGKHVLEWLFATGRVTTAARRRFERIYDLAERVLPADVLAATTPAADDAKRALLLESAAALGVGTAGDLADYFRLHRPTARTLVEGLAAEGRLERVRVEGWKDSAFRLPGTRAPGRVPRATALVSPFDSLVFERARTERLFGFHYRLEIYTPAAKRRYGYYVLPFLLDGAIVSRLDLKADRERGRLLVRAAHLEPGAEAERTATALAPELARMAGWLGLRKVVVERKGTLAAALRSAVASGCGRP